MNHAIQYLHEVEAISRIIPPTKIEEMVRELGLLRYRGGRLFIVGLGGSAANASHMVNDIRKLCHIEAYAPTDNVSELTARMNDEGAATVFASCLRFIRPGDALMVLSVGGGTEHTSPAIAAIVKGCAESGITVMGIVGKDGGITAKYGSPVVIIPIVNHSHVTPHTEAFQAVVWHCIVSHPDLQRQATKW